METVLNKHVAVLDTILAGTDCIALEGWIGAAQKSGVLNTVRPVYRAIQHQAALPLVVKLVSGERVEVWSKELVDLALQKQNVELVRAIVAHGGWQSDVDGERYLDWYWTSQYYMDSGMRVLLGHETTQQRVLNNYACAAVEEERYELFLWLLSQIPSCVLVDDFATLYIAIVRTYDVRYLDALLRRPEVLQRFNELHLLQRAIVKNGHVNCVRRLLQHERAEVYISEDNPSLLELAVEYGTVEVVELLAKDLRVHTRDVNERSICRAEAARFTSKANLLKEYIFIDQ